MGGRTDADVVCPYYKHDERQTINCEGVEEGSALHLAFATRPQLMRYKRLYCRDCWKKCMIAGALNRKYDYE